MHNAITIDPQLENMLCASANKINTHQAESEIEIGNDVDSKYRNRVSKISEAMKANKELKLNANTMDIAKISKIMNINFHS